jgi:4-amino-4-deoxy-L-arabinose transferase-like glycosyltransferase
MSGQTSLLPRGPEKNLLLAPWTAMLMAIGIYLALSCFRLGWTDLSSDEGRFGLSATNILTDRHQLAIVSEDPLGPPGTKPYMYPLTIAAVFTLLGKSEFTLRFVSVLSLLVAAFCFFALSMILTGNRTLSWLVFALFLLNPATITYARVAIPEPLVAAFGSLGLVAMAKFRDMPRTRWAILGGIAFGCGFLSKLWLVGPFILAASLLILEHWYRRRENRMIAGLGVAAMSFLIVAASHLLFVLWLAPPSLPHWENIYFIFSMKGRAGGVGYDPDMWYRPWWFYIAAVFKGSFFGLPLVFLGAWSLVKLRSWPLALVFVGLFSPVVVFSFFRVKQATYVFPAIVAITFLMSEGFLYLRSNTDWERLAVATMVSLGLAFFFWRGVGALQRQEFLQVVLLFILYLGIAGLWVRYRRAAESVLSLVVITTLLFAGIVVVRKNLDHRTYYREIASFFTERLKSRKPQDIVFVSPEFPAFEFYTFRCGQYWKTFYFNETYAEFFANLRGGNRVFYVVDPSGQLYGSKVDSDKLAALQDYAIDVTSQVEKDVGHSIPLRVFIPRDSIQVSDTPKETGGAI